MSPDKEYAERTMFAAYTVESSRQSGIAEQIIRWIFFCKLLSVLLIKLNFYDGRHQPLKRSSNWILVRQSLCYVLPGIWAASPPQSDPAALACALNTRHISNVVHTSYVNYTSGVLGRYESISCLFVCVLLNIRTRFYITKCWYSHLKNLYVVREPYWSRSIRWNHF